jgi:hypothetical protein
MPMEINLEADMLMIKLMEMVDSTIKRRIMKKKVNGKMESRLDNTEELT